MRISDRVVMGQTLSAIPERPVDGITPVIQDVNAEGCVLLENDGMLPLSPGDKISVFGRMQLDYYMSGTGSGGMVNTEYTMNILDCLEESGQLELNDELATIYREWNARNPHDSGDGWTEPWSQKGMRLTGNMVRKAAEKTKKAIIIIARTAGEDKDNAAKEGSYLLSKSEQKMIALVADTFEEVCVILNTGNIMDMKWTRESNINAVMYVWQGGMDGARSVADLLLGKRYPSGKLTDTIALNMGDYPSYKGFNNDETLHYIEDVYVGYRYFETFARDRVLYPFGYGLGYTTFFITCEQCSCENNEFSAKFKVKNTGKFPGKEVVQLYYRAAEPNSPSRQLAAFVKTEEIAPEEETLVSMSFNISDMASFDEKKHAFVMVEGDYAIFAGANVRDAQQIYTYECRYDTVVEKCRAYFPTHVEMRRIANNNSRILEGLIEPTEAIESGETPLREIPYTGDTGIKLVDVLRKRASMDAFIAQLSTYDLACLSQGEGMNSPRVRPGTGGAIGGVTDSLVGFGIPAICVTDGPSGLRLDNGDKASCVPIGTMIACTWNTELAEKLYTYVGMEAYAHKIDGLLGPGINIHRVPLCGRNFEYYSEDPYLTGAIATAVCSGLGKAGVAGVVKHFAANNRENNRKRVNTIVTERALREIYFKPFRMVALSGKTHMLMTAYNRINDVYCAANYRLVQTLLRGEWGYEGLVMTDWWANTLMDENGEPTEDRVAQVKSGNDVFMVNEDVTKPAELLVKAVEAGKLSVAELQRNAEHICRTIMTTPSFERFIDDGGESRESENAK